MLLLLFNPIVSSLRALQQTTQLGKVQRRLGCRRTSRGSLSEATRLFDAERLKSIIHALASDLEPLAKDPRLKDLHPTLTLVDGTLLSALPKIAEARWRKSESGSGLVKWRLHTHFEVQRYVPQRIDLTRDGA
ncbi:MAG: hypothetical protein QGF59_03835 [Pirellulaceae bacterium]|nr:hypothetical protein [Pirellulaceae bacterium]